MTTVRGPTWLLPAALAATACTEASVPTDAPSRPIESSSAESGASGMAGASPCSEQAAGSTLDVSYAEFEGDQPFLTQLDVYTPSRPPCGRQPTVVWVHGGGWRQGDKSGGNIEDKAALMAELGYVFVSVNYRLSAYPELHDSDVKFPVHAEDVGRALAWIEDNIGDYGGDPSRLALLGHSAGAHLVALVGLDPDYIATAGGSEGLVDCVGSFDTEGYDVEQAITTSGPALASLYLNAFGDESSTWREASPVQHIGERTPPPAFLLAQRGSLSRQQLAIDFGARLQQAGGEVTIIDAIAYSHAEVNQMIGSPGDRVMTPPLVDFLRSCLDY